MAFTLRQINSQPFQLPESSRVKAANDEFIQDPPDAAAQLRAEPVRKPEKAKKAKFKFNFAIKNSDTATMGKSQPAAKPTMDTILDSRNRFSRLESMIALLGFGIIVSVLGFTWMSWDKDYAIVGDADTAYNYGLTGGLMMLVILLYSLRKRIKFMRRMGDITYWYYVHFSLGIIAPVLIVLHTSFELRSVNASMAFIAMMLVVSSGFLGRYIYTRASYGLQFLERESKALTDAKDGGIFHNHQRAMQDLEKQVADFCDLAVEPPATVMSILDTLLTVRIRCHNFHRRTRRELAGALAAVMVSEKWNDAQLQEQLAEEQKALADHMKLVARIAVARGFEKLAARWRLLHVPILYLLALSVGAHVLAVHMY